MKHPSDRQSPASNKEWVWSCRAFGILKIHFPRVTRSPHSCCLSRIASETCFKYLFDFPFLNISKFLHNSVVETSWNIIKLFPPRFHQQLCLPQFPNSSCLARAWHLPCEIGNPEIPCLDETHHAHPSNKATQEATSSLFNQAIDGPTLGVSMAYQVTMAMVRPCWISFPPWRVLMNFLLLHTFLVWTAMNWCNFMQFPAPKSMVLVAFNANRPLPQRLVSKLQWTASRRAQRCKSTPWLPALARFPHLPTQCLTPTVPTSLRFAVVWVQNVVKKCQKSIRIQTFSSSLYGFIQVGPVSLELVRWQQSFPLPGTFLGVTPQKNIRPVTWICWSQNYDIYQTNHWKHWSRWKNLNLEASWSLAFVQDVCSSLWNGSECLFRNVDRGPNKQFGSICRVHWKEDIEEEKCLESKAEKNARHKCLWKPQTVPSPTISSQCFRRGIEYTVYRLSQVGWNSFGVAPRQQISWKNGMSDMSVTSSVCHGVSWCIMVYPSDHLAPTSMWDFLGLGARATFKRMALSTVSNGRYDHLSRSRAQRLHSDYTVTAQFTHAACQIFSMPFMVSLRVYKVKYA